MKIGLESEGDFPNMMNYLKKTLQGIPNATLNRIGSDGDKALSNGTPKDTGETAAGWTHEISKHKDKSVIEWSNTAHPEAGVSVAKLIDQGHGTGTGGYVPPRPYIKESMGPVWESAGDLVAKELKD